MAAALPGFAMQAIANLWGQQPELAAGVYAVGAVAAAVPQYVPTFEQAKLWCRKSRWSTRPVAKSIPVAADTPDMVNSIISQARQTTIIIITRSASTWPASGPTTTVGEHVEIEILDSPASSDPAHAMSDSLTMRSTDIVESIPFQSQTGTRATSETSPEVDNEVVKAFLVGAPSISSDHVIWTSSNRKPVLSDIVSKEKTPSPSPRSLQSPSTHIPTHISAAQDQVLEQEDQDAIESAAITASVVNTETSHGTDVVSEVSTSVSLHGEPSNDMPASDTPLVFTGPKEQTVSSTPIGITSTFSALINNKPPPTPFPVIVDNLPSTSKLATLSSIPCVTSRQEFGERNMAHHAEQKPKGSAHYTNPISWLDVVLVFVPSLFITMSIGLAGNDPDGQDLYGTLVALLCVAVIAFFPYLDSRWPILRYSSIAMYRYFFASMSSYMLCLTEFSNRWQAALAGSLDKQQVDHFIIDRASYAVLIGLTLVILFIIVSVMITRLPQRAEPSQWKATLLCLCIGFVVGLAVIWFRVYVQDFVLIFAMAGLIYLLHSHLGKVLRITSHAIQGTYRLSKVARPWIALYAALGTIVYSTSHQQQLSECFNRAKDGVFPPFSHRAILVKYVVLPIAVFVMHQPITRVVPGHQDIRAWIQDKYRVIVSGRVIRPWLPDTDRDLWWELATIVLGADNVLRFILEWLIPILEAVAVLFMALALMCVLVVVYQNLLKVIWNTVRVWIIRTMETATQAIGETKPQIATNTTSLQIGTTQQSTYVASDSFASTWTVVSSAFAKLPMKLRFLYRVYIEPVAVYIDVSYHNNYCRGLAWWWIPRATTIILATICCTTGWVIAARAYPKHKIRSCLNFATTFMVVYTLGALGVLRCSQDYPIALTTVLVILLFQHYQPLPAPEIQAPDVEAPPNLPGRLATSAPVPIGLPQSSPWVWQRLAGWFHANSAARAARERAIRDARSIADQEDAEYQAAVDRMRQNQPSIHADHDYLQRLRAVGSETHMAQPSRDDGDISTVERGWDFTRPFRRMDTERQYQAALGKDQSVKAMLDAMPEASAESSPVSAAQIPAVSVLAGVSTVAPGFAPTLPAPPITFTPPATSASPAMATPLTWDTPSSSLLRPTPTATSIAVQAPDVGISEILAKTDVKDSLPVTILNPSKFELQREATPRTRPCLETTGLTAVVEDTPFHKPTAVPGTRPAEPDAAVVVPDDETISLTSTISAVSGINLKDADASPRNRFLQNEDKLVGEVGSRGLEDRSDTEEHARADSQYQDQEQNDNQSDEDDFSLDGDELGFDDGSFDKDPIEIPEQLAGEALTAAKQLREQITREAEQDNGAPTSDCDSHNSEKDGQGDIPMGDAPRDGVIITKPEVFLTQSNDDVAMGNTDDDFKEATPVPNTAVPLDAPRFTTDLSTFQSSLPNESDLSSVSNLAAQPVPAASMPLPKAPFSAIPERAGTLSLTQQELDTRYALPSIYQRPLPRPTNPTHTDSEEQWRNRLLGGENTLTKMRRFREEAARESKDGRNGGDLPPGPGGSYGGNHGSGGDDDGGDGGGGIDPPAPPGLFSGGGAVNTHEPSPPFDRSEAMSDSEGEYSSGEDFYGAPDPDSDDGQTPNETVYSKDQKDEHISDDNGIHPGSPVNRQASAIDGLTAAAPPADAGTAVAATTSTTMTNSDEDTEMPDLLGTNVDDNSHANADGGPSSDTIPKLLTTQEPRVNPSTTCNPFSIANYGTFPGNEVVSKVQGGSSEHSSERADASKTGFNFALRVDSNDESDLSDPPDDEVLDKTGEDLLIEELYGPMPVLKKGGREITGYSELGREDTHARNKGTETAASFLSNNITTSHSIITDEKKGEAEKSCRTTDEDVLGFIDSINDSEKQEGGKFLTSKFSRGRNADGTTSSTPPALTSSSLTSLPPQAPLLDAKKRYNGPLSFDPGEGDVLLKEKSTSPITKTRLGHMAQFDPDPLSRAISQSMANKASDTSSTESPVQASPAVTTSTPFQSESQDPIDIVPLPKPNPSPSPYHYPSIKASSLPFDPSRPKPYVPPGFDPTTLDRTNSTNPFLRFSSDNPLGLPYIQRNADVSSNWRPEHQPMKPPEVTSPKPSSSLIPRLAYNPMNASAGIAAPLVVPPAYDPLQPSTGTVLQSSSIDPSIHNSIEYAARYSTQSIKSDSDQSHDGSQGSAPQSPAQSAAATANLDKMMDVDGEHRVLAPGTQVTTTQDEDADTGGTSDAAEPPPTASGVIGNGSTGAAVQGEDVDMERTSVCTSTRSTAESFDDSDRYSSDYSDDGNDSDNTPHDQDPFGAVGEAFKTDNQPIQWRNGEQNEVQPQAVVQSENDERADVSGDDGDITMGDCSPPINKVSPH